MDNIFFELTLVLVAAGVIAYILHFLKQPSIIAYIITGLLIGPLALYRLHHGEILHGLAEIGMTLLLFMVGLDLDISQLRRIGRAAVVAGIGQIIFTGAIGYALATMLGLAPLPALYIAIALTFSSTIIVVKLLSEKKDMQSLYGKLAVGIFLVQDIAAILILILLAGLTNSAGFGSLNGGLFETVIFTLAKAFMIGVIVVTLSRTIFPRLLHSLLKSDELLLLFSLGWALGLAAFFTSPWIGFNAAIGGFVAGLALANTGAHYQISGRIKPLRDFFIVIFFIVLGSQLVVSNIALAIWPAIILAVFVLIGNPIIITLILGLMGYKIRTSFMTGVTVAQISEFSLILMALGLAAGHVNETHVTIVTMVGITTIGISSYGVIYSNKLYEWLSRSTYHWLERKSRRNNKHQENLGNTVYRQHIVLIGANRLGSHLVNRLHKQKDQQFIIIDFNPDIVSHYRSLGIAAVCGDIADPYIQEISVLAEAKLIISTIPDFHDTMALMEYVQTLSRKPKLIATASDEHEALQLYKAGASYVLLPHFVGGVHLNDIIRSHSDAASLRKLKAKHLEILRKTHLATI
ncbi:MAG TPA: cation:proton antiporter [Candidatus Doudnabacteria bacterium]|mgnify:CR=1 FL=1|nr:cation:proton antiporter [Candidatus Doudnabacteria bacterium]